MGPFVKKSSDYYVIQRLYFDRLDKTPWGRGDLFSSYYHGFDDYLTAKAAFDNYESADWWSVGEAEHSLFMVSAKTKWHAVFLLEKSKAHGFLLHETPYGEILKGRKAWEEHLRMKAEEAARLPDEHDE
ncbi:MAG TPA: hypothetical protein VIF02_16640 [Methylocella sp.]|jgi:hypothetical protein